MSFWSADVCRCYPRIFGVFACNCVLRGIQVPSVARRLIGIGFHASLPIKRHRPPCCTLVGSRGALCACAQETKCDQALARLWFLTRLSPTRSDRTRTRCALLQSLWPAILRPGVAGLLSRKMEWRRVRSLLDTDADWADVELWPIAPNNWPGARSSHSDGFTSDTLRTALHRTSPLLGGKADMPIAQMSAYDPKRTCGVEGCNVLPSPFRAPSPSSSNKLWSIRFGP